MSEVSLELGVYSLSDLQGPPGGGPPPSFAERLDDIVAYGILADRLGLDVYGVGEHHALAFASSSANTGTRSPVDASSTCTVEVAVTLLAASARVGSRAGSIPADRYTRNGVDGEKPSSRFHRVPSNAIPPLDTGSVSGSSETRLPVRVVGSSTSQNDDGNGVRQSSPMSGLHAGRATESGAAGDAQPATESASKTARQGAGVRVGRVRPGVAAPDGRPWT